MSKPLTEADWIRDRTQAMLYMHKGELKKAREIFTKWHLIADSHTLTSQQCIGALMVLDAWDLQVDA